jgi:hypothetical protein
MKDHTRFVEWHPLEVRLATGDCDECMQFRVCVCVLRSSCQTRIYKDVVTFCNVSGIADCNWATGFLNPVGVALDTSSGVLYVTDFRGSTLCRVAPTGGAPDSMDGRSYVVVDYVRALPHDTFVKFFSL